MKYLIAGFHHERKQYLWRPENGHVQDAANIDQSLYAKPRMNKQDKELHNVGTHRLRKWDQLLQ